MLQSDPIVGCSKGAQGLSVHVRETGVFTGTTSSPSPWPRQCPSRYTIRAGRNLPDKEFRSVYLALFPEEPDFIFPAAYASVLQFSGCAQALRRLGAHPSPLRAKPAETR